MNSPAMSLNIEAETWGIDITLQVVRDFNPLILADMRREALALMAGAIALLDGARLDTDGDDEAIAAIEEQIEGQE